MTRTSEVLTGLGEGLRDAGAASLASYVERVTAASGDDLHEERACLLALTDFAVRVAAPAALDALRRGGLAAYLRALGPVIDTAGIITAREAVACLRVERDDTRSAALMAGMVELTRAALWADGATAAQLCESHPLAALVDAEVRGASFSDPLDLTYFEQFGYHAGEALGAALAVAPSLDDALRALLAAPSRP